MDEAKEVVARLRCLELAICFYHATGGIYPAQVVSGANTFWTWTKTGTLPTPEEKPLGDKPAGTAAV
jgi:hypothetical protein